MSMEGGTRHTVVSRNMTMSLIHGTITEPEYPFRLLTEEHEQFVWYTGRR